MSLRPSPRPAAIVIAFLFCVTGVASGLLAGEASAASTLPPLGMQLSSVQALTDAGAAPKYGSYWVGDWMATSGWGGFDNAMATAVKTGATPVVYWYYWGDSISPACVLMAVTGTRASARCTISRIAPASRSGSPAVLNA